MRGQRGQTMVELAIVMPVILIVLIGVVQFALVYHAKNVAATATQEGISGGGRAAVRTPRPRRQVQSGPQR